MAGMLAGTGQTETVELVVRSRSRARCFRVSPAAFPSRREQSLATLPWGLQMMRQPLPPTPSPQRRGGAEEQPLPPTPSPKRRGGARQRHLPEAERGRKTTLVPFCSPSPLRGGGRGEGFWPGASLHVERIDVERELHARGRVQGRPRLARQLVQLARAHRLQLEVKAEIILQPEYWRLGGTEQ